MNAAAADEVLSRGSRSFAAAARVFDADTRRAATLLYAWCRHCDDVVDGQAYGHDARPPADAPARLERLYDATRRALAGGPPDAPAFEALQWVVRRHGIPHRQPYALLDGFAMDVHGARFAALPDTLRYCYHVAGVVGLMMAHVMGVRDDATLDRACDLGLAFQLTNIARDVAADARVGRAYVPEAWLAEAGTTREALLAGARPPTVIGALQRRLVDAAEPYYRSSRHGLAALPFRSAWAVAAALAVYRDIGRVLQASTPGRASVGPVRRVGLVAAASVVAAGARVHPAAPAPRSDALWCRPA